MFKIHRLPKMFRYNLSWNDKGRSGYLWRRQAPKLHDHLAFKLSWRSPGRHPPDRSPLHCVHRKTNMLPNFKNSKFKTPFHLPQPLSTEMYHDALLGLARWWKPKSILHLSAFYSRPSASYLRPSASHPSPSSCRSRKSTSTILFMIRTLLLLYALVVTSCHLSLHRIPSAWFVRWLSFIPCLYSRHNLPQLLPHSRVLTVEDSFLSFLSWALLVL